jgi:hypothetical protein
MRALILVAVKGGVWLGAKDDLEIEDLVGVIATACRSCRSNNRGGSHYHIWGLQLPSFLSSLFRNELNKNSLKR